MERIHFIAIGGAAMHNLAIALQELGHKVTGSDDQINEPSRSRLSQKGLLPQVEGWHPEQLTKEIDVVVLGMHARIDNPELLRAQELGVKVVSYPEFLYEKTKLKKRLVVGGSHGKTSITSMVMHVLKYHAFDFDYMVGAQVEGFDTMVRLSDTAEIAVFEGDEYLSSPIDLRPKFHWYKPHVGLISGVAWDHINVFPTLEGYEHQFELFADDVKETLILYKGDSVLNRIGAKQSELKGVSFYAEAESEVVDDQTYLLGENEEKTAVAVFGAHNMQNIEGAKLMCKEVGVSSSQFYEAIASFSGAARRLETVAESETSTVFRDFAHSPSKLQATTTAVKQQYKDRKLVAVMELHTFSSLKKEFLPQYKHTMIEADIAFVYFDKATVAHKKLEEISKEEVFDGFDQENVTVFTDSAKMFSELKSMDWANSNLLLMSSGTFSGVDVVGFGKDLLE